MGCLAATPHRVSVSQLYCVVIFQRGTQQEISATKHAVSRRSCDCHSWQSE